MPGESFTLIDDGRIAPITATVTASGVRVAPATLASALGWELKPQGLCRDERCVPVADRHRLVHDDGVDLAAFAAALARPLAVDVAERVAYLGTSADDRAAQLASLEAPQFTLPDLDGRPHALADYRGKKILLVAYASW